MEKFLLGTNWKMHKTREQAIAYTQELLELTQEMDGFQFFIIPPYTDLWEIRALTKGTHLMMGAQNMHELDEGPYTGEISPAMLQEIGVDIIEIGHSERRALYNETDFSVNRKTLSALANGFTALVCVGENMAQKEADASHAYIAYQLQVALAGVNSDDIHRLWIAYEPVWSIGESGIPADPEYANKIHKTIKSVLCEKFGSASDDIPVLYGGSVNPANCVSLIAQPSIDGLFIGRSAWDAKGFRHIADLLLQQ